MSASPIILAAVFGSTALADTTILVPSSSEGRDACEAAAEAAGESVQCARHLTKALMVASEAVNAGGAMTVRIHLAAGTYQGDMDAGNYTLPAFKNPEAALIFEGGYDTAYKARDPWTTPTVFATNGERGGPYWVVGRDTQTASLTIDGILWDMAGSNKYDGRTNSLLKGSSKTDKVIKFNYWELQDLTFRNNVFMNAPHRVTETLVRATNDEATITWENNVFLNNVIPIKIDTARGRHKPKQIVVKRNSFLLNWAYNPDPNTGNPGSLDIGSRDAATEVVVEGNLFFGNFGGAIQIAPDNAPKVSISRNNFVGNGLLHGKLDSDASVVISARNTGLHPLHGTDYIEDITDLTKGDGRGNVSINPGLSIRLATSTQTVDAEKVQPNEDWNNTARRILGMNLDGGTVAIKDYAPMQTWNADAVFPTEAAAAEYGAQRVIAGQ